MHFICDLYWNCLISAWIKPHDFLLFTWLLIFVGRRKKETRRTWADYGRKQQKNWRSPEKAGRREIGNGGGAKKDGRREAETEKGAGEAS